MATKKLTPEQAIRILIAINMSQKGLATKLRERGFDIEDPTISSWIQKGKCPPKYVLTLEELSNGLVSRYDLRPDIFGEGPEK